MPSGSVRLVFPADTVAEGLQGASGASLVERCLAEPRVLITLDLDVANVRAYPPEIHDGIIVFRSNPRINLRSSRNCSVLFVLKQKSPEKELWIIEQNRIRFRES